MVKTRCNLVIRYLFLAQRGEKRQKEIKMKNTWLNCCFKGQCFSEWVTLVPGCQNNESKGGREDEMQCLQGRIIVFIFWATLSSASLVVDHSCWVWRGWTMRCCEWNIYSSYHNITHCPVCPLKEARLWRTDAGEIVFFSTMCRCSK